MRTLTRLFNTTRSTLNLKDVVENLPKCFHLVRTHWLIISKNFGLSEIKIFKQQNKISYMFLHTTQFNTRILSFSSCASLVNE